MADRPVRIQRKRTAGWRMPKDAVYVGRPSIFGNPFSAHEYGHYHAIDLFRRWIAGSLTSKEESQLSRCDSRVGMSLYQLRKEILRDLPTLRGKSLACWCRAGRPCHADILLELANAPQSPSAGERE